MVIMSANGVDKLGSLGLLAGDVPPLDWRQFHANYSSGALGLLLIMR